MRTSCPEDVITFELLSGIPKESFHCFDPRKSVRGVVHVVPSSVCAFVSRIRSLPVQLAQQNRLAVGLISGIFVIGF